ncbi:hypothetical protein CLV59_110163 [Chitinophaga dinghuensis]|uniref:Uncharacterized protein n=1 Tax=Chitinophaga dinghuensis TaxID=1539050 RepID=A0A327VMX7_9BACT|nr:hypothetical protein [Chitinophaga dinghuensis]RAJ75116.1 hypothetical protein CLV59_110163 [Chitinophaga dinghuensis]
MKYLPLYFLTLVLGICCIIGCRKDNNEQTLQELKAKNAALALDSTGHPRDTTRHDTIPHPGDTTRPHWPDSPHHPVDTPRWPVDSPRHPIDTPRWPVDTPRHPVDTPRYPGSDTLRGSTRRF